MGFVSDKKLHDSFIKSERKHIMMITNHGIHQWNVLVGLPDTGGQNVFVNMFTESLVKLGYKVTIANRGGFKHPTTDDLHEGVHYSGEHKRILYLEDDVKEFVPKEVMDPLIPKLTNFLYNFIQEEKIGIDLLVTHYWDAAKLGVMLNDKLVNNKETKLTHIWVPHSVGALKKANVDPSRWEELKVDDRINEEKKFIPLLDGVASTSSAIADSLRNDYNHDPRIFLPPCIDDTVIFPRELSDNDPAWKFLEEGFNLPQAEIRKRRIIMEVSRTAKSKRKDILIKAFLKVRKKHPDVLLAVSMDQTKDLAVDLKKMLEDEGVLKNTFLIGRDWDTLPPTYSLASIYCSPSIMEGFGMAVQEGAATAVPVIGSTLIPFVKEYILGKDIKNIDYEGMTGAPLQQGEAGFLVEPDDVDGFAKAMEILLDDEKLRAKMGKRAYEITIPYFTWKSMSEDFLKKAGV